MCTEREHTMRRIILTAVSTALATGAALVAVLTSEAANA
jgi:hypothetical protein